MIFVELPLFQKYLQFTDEELAKIQEEILEDPRRGDLVPGGRGLRKLRAAIAGRGKFGETEDDVLRRVFGLPPLSGSNSAAAAAQLLLLEVPARPNTSNQGVCLPQLQLPAGCRTAMSPITTLWAGAEVMYGDKNDKNPGCPSGTGSSVRTSRTNTLDHRGACKWCAGQST